MHYTSDWENMLTPETDSDTKQQTEQETQPSRVEEILETAKDHLQLKLDFRN